MLGKNVPRVAHVGNVHWQRRLRWIYILLHARAAGNSARRMQGRVRINKAACVSTHLIYLIFRQTRVPPADPHAQGQPARARYLPPGDISLLVVSLPSELLCATSSLPLGRVLLPLAAYLISHIDFDCRYLARDVLKLVARLERSKRDRRESKKHTK